MGKSCTEWLWWSGYLLSLALPLSALAFFAGGPWDWRQALAWTVPVWLLTLADFFSPDLKRAPPDGLADWPFDAILYSLCLLQPLNILFMLRLVAQLQWDSPAQIAASLAELLAVRIVMGTTSCCAAIAPAHELIHRRAPWQRLLGRMLLCSVLYDHFSIVHQRAHHRHLNGARDPASALPGESYEHFFRRTARLQWQTAWALNRRGTAVGVIGEGLLLAAIAAFFGPLALLMFVYQALAAVRLLEAVNYFQHWGLRGRRPAAWTCDNAVSLFLFLGLPRHVDHHRHALRTYPNLRSHVGGPRLWHGYLGMAWLVKNRCDLFRRRAEPLLNATADERLPSENHASNRYLAV